MRFKEALSGPGLAAIAEFKRRSPSMGDIRPDARVENVVRAYSENGASAISVLVDERFAGTIADLAAARATTGVPLLAKGFFSTEEQLLELRRAGADAALLILRDLDDATTARLMAYAETIELDTLVEAHDEAELDRAHYLGAGVIGINAHNARAEVVGPVCGLTRQEDVDAAVEAGADMTGFIFAGSSPRRAPAVLSVPDTVLSVAVFVGEPEERGADLVQVYPSAEGKVRGRHATMLRGEKPVALVWDQPWDEVDPDHWDSVPSEGRVMLAGKLGPDNVRAAIDAVHPWAVDAASRLESAPGIKDHDKVRAFVQEAR